MTSHSMGTKNLTVGNVRMNIIRFAFPLLLSQIFQQLYNTADTFIVGKYLGTRALAAVSASGTLIFMLASFFIGTGMGSGVAIARYFGAKDEKKVMEAIYTNFAFAIIAGIVLTLVGVLLTPYFLVWMKTDEAILPEAISYFRYFFLGSMAMVLYNTCGSIMNAVGDSKRPLYYLIFSSITNIVLDLLFIGILGFHVWAAALATVISQTVSAILCIIHLTGKNFPYRVNLKKIKIYWKMMKEILRYGIPAGIQNSVIAFANVIVQTQINSFGQFATAGYGIHSKIEGFAFLPINCFTMAISTFTSQNLGARMYDRAKQGASFGILAGVAMAGIIGIINYKFAPFLIGIFDDNPSVVYYGVLQARIISLFYCLLAFSHCVASVCRGAGKAIVPMVIMLAVWCLFRVTYIMMVMKIFADIRPVYMAYPITWGISSAIYLIYYLRSDWIHGFDGKPRVKN